MKKAIKIYKLILPIFIFLPILTASAYTLEMSLPGSGSTFSSADAGAFLANYLGALFKFGFYLLVFLAVAMITYGGILYMVPGKTGEAREKMWGAVIGVFFLICSSLILQTIDPELLSLSPKILKKIKINKEAFNPTGIFLDPMQAADKALYGKKVIGNGSQEIYYYNFVSNPYYNTETKCEEFGREQFGARFKSVAFSEETKNCSVYTYKTNEGFKDLQTDQKTEKQIQENINNTNATSGPIETY